MNEIMIDLETLGTQTDSIIASIGACRFDINTGQIGETFYCAMEWTSLFKEQNGRLQRRLDLGTLKWWMRQNEEARVDLISGDVTLETGLGMLNDYITDTPNSGVWANGAAFDVPILEHAYGMFEGYEIPWKFWNVRDVRTMVYLANEISYDWKAANPRQDTHHNALEDAIYQAQYVSDIWQQLRR